MGLVTLDPTAIPVPMRTRLAVAMGTELGLGRNATQAEIEAYLRRHLKAKVEAIEDAAAKAAAVAASFDPGT
jgi:hypothetical protein